MAKDVYKRQAGDLVEDDQGIAAGAHQAAGLIGFQGTDGAGAVRVGIYRLDRAAVFVKGKAFEGSICNAAGTFSGEIVGKYNRGVHGAVHKAAFTEDGGHGRMF